MKWHHHAVIGSFSSRNDAENVMYELKHGGYRDEDISVIMTQGFDEEGPDEEGRSGILTGSAIGALAGLVAGIGAIAIPGIGPVFAVGPLATALGFTGVGAATGALTGGMVSSLIDIGIAQQDAHTYEHILKNGGVVISVLVDERDRKDVVALFKEHNAADTQIILPDEITGVNHVFIHPDDEREEEQPEEPSEKTRIDRRSPYNRTGMYAKSRN